ncbi:MAG: CapA family protein [bacterium]
MNTKRTVYLALVLGTVSTLLFVPGFQPERTVSVSDPEPVTVLLGGDVFIGPRLNHYTNRNEYWGVDKALSERISQADLFLANLEGPLTAGADTTGEKSYHLRNDPRTALPILKDLGMDGVSLANNHTLDFGRKGLLETLRLLNKNDIKHTGAGASLERALYPVFFTRKGRTIAFLSFSNTFPERFWAKPEQVGTAYGKLDHVEALTSFADARADRVIISFHWGGEGEVTSKDYQITLARRAVDAGADVVFGHHPHTLQPVERYRGSLIFYSLGNFIFTTMSHTVNYGLLAEVSFVPGRDPAAKTHVMNVNNHEVHYRPEFVKTLENPVDGLRDLSSDTEFITQLETL